MNTTVAQPNLILAQKLNRLAWIISAVVILLVVLMRSFKIESSIDFSFLPPFHASLNALTAILLVAALLAIKKKNARRHRQLMQTAMISSILFLASYVLYHLTTVETKYCVEGAIRIVYFFFLITHVILAAVILPFILFTYIRAYTNQFDKHVKMARWVFPLWLYVAVTGPVLYWMLKDCYGVS